MAVPETIYTEEMDTHAAQRLAPRRRAWRRGQRYPVVGAIRSYKASPGKIASA